MENDDNKLHYMQISVDHMEMTKYLSNEQCGLLIKLIFAYFRGEKTEKDIESEVKGKHQIILPIFSQLKMSIDRGRSAYIKRCEQNRKNGQKGGAPKGNQNARKKKDVEPPEEPIPEENEEIEEYDEAEENEEIEYEPLLEYITPVKKEYTPEAKEREVEARKDTIPYIIDNVQRELSEQSTSLENIFNKNQAIRFFSVFSICDYQYGTRFSLTKFYEKKTSYFGGRAFLMNIREYNNTDEFLDELEKTQKEKYIISIEKFYFSPDDEYADTFAAFKQAAAIAIEEYLKQPKQPNG